MAAGIIAAAGTIVVGLYLWDRWHMNNLAKEAALALKKQEIETARVAREVMEREIRIKEEQARIALEIMKRNAKIRNGIIIGVTATVTGVGLGYAIYRLYKSISTSRQQQKQEQDLLAAKKVLLTSLAPHTREEVGPLGIPSACEQAAFNLLTLKGGKPTLDEIKSSYHAQGPQILQQTGTPVAMLAQPN